MMMWCNSYGSQWYGALRVPCRCRQQGGYWAFSANSALLNSAPTKAKEVLGKFSWSLL